MSRLSIEIPETAKSLAEATVYIKGTQKELLDCLGFLAYAVAETIHMPPIIMLAMVSASLSSVQGSIRKQILLISMDIFGACTGEPFVRAMRTSIAKPHGRAERST